MFDTVLIANRGEIAVRIARTLRRLGVTSVAVYSDADAAARHTREADLAVRLGPDPRAYLDGEAILAAARRTGAQAIHPGYGFLSENADFARAVDAAGLVFVGPPAHAIEVMGDKIGGKATVEDAGVPVVPGFAENPGDPMGAAELAEAAARVGYPVLIKPSAGGGGKGMRLVTDPADLAAQVAAARREAAGAFGDTTLLVERYLDAPRHIEIQVLADTHGNVVHLGERECSLQRRHQKIVEEAPSALLTPEEREEMGSWAVEAALSCGYEGAGTVEFIVAGSDPDQRYFMEMNTRLQVEHPVTELVTGLDLVEWQLRVAAGEPLPFDQGEIRYDGHAVEARVYAEDPARGFLPTGGRVLALSVPDQARVDSGLDVGTVVGGAYDPMLAKVAAWAPDRPAALRRLRAALAEFTLLGVGTNVGFLRALLADPDVESGALDTGLVERRVDELTTGGVPDDVLAAAALARSLAAEPDDSTSLFDRPDGWRLGEPAWTTWRHTPLGDDVTRTVRTRGLASDALVAIGDGEPVPASAYRDADTLVVTVDGVTRRYRTARDGDVLWLGRDGSTWALRETGPEVAGTDRAAAAGPCRAPMPGTVTVTHVEVGDRVAAGTPLLVIEAMKMEHVITAPHDGVVTELRVAPGRSVALDEPLVLVSEKEE